MQSIIDMLNAGGSDESLAVGILQNSELKGMRSEVIGLLKQWVKKHNNWAYYHVADVAGNGFTSKVRVDRSWFRPLRNKLWALYGI
jgi:hypothetical protein